MGGPSTVSPIEAWIAQKSHGLPTNSDAWVTLSERATKAWLTVALSVEVVALAWIWSRLRVAEIRAVALLVVAAGLRERGLAVVLITHNSAIAGIGGRTEVLSTEMRLLPAGDPPHSGSAPALRWRSRW